MRKKGTVKTPKEKKKLTLRSVLIFQAILLLFMGITLFIAETRITERAQLKNLRERLESITATFTKSYEETQEITKMYNDTMNSRVRSLAYLLDRDVSYNSNNIQDLCDLYGVDQIFLDNREHKDTDEMHYFTAFRKNGRRVTIGKNTEDFNLLMNNIYTNNKVLQDVVAQDDMFFIVTNADGNIVYYPESEFIGRHITDLGIQMSDLSLDSAKWMRINKQFYYLSSIENNNLDITISCGIRSSRMTTNSHIAVGILYAVICIILTILITYIYFAKQEVKRSGNPEYSHKMVTKKMALVSVFGLLLVAVTTYYVQTLFALSLHTLQTNNEKRDIEVNLEEAANSAEQLKASYDDRYLSEAKIISYILSDKPELRTKEELKELSGIFDLQYIMLFDSQGRETLSDSPIVGFELSDDPESQSYPFHVLLHGIPYYIQDAMEDDLTGEFHQFIGVPMTTEDGSAYDGFLQIAVSPDKLQSVLEEVSLNKVLVNTLSASSDVVIAIDPETKLITSSENEALIGLPAADFGIEEEQIKNRYFGYLKFNDRRYYADSFIADNQYVYLLALSATLFSGRITMTIFTLLVTMLNMLFITLLYRRYDVVNPASIADDPYVEVTMADGGTKRTLNIISRMMRNTPAWNKKTAEEKTGYIVRIVIGFLAAGMLVAFALRNVLYTEDTIFGFIVSNKWEKGFNVFAVTEVLGIIAIYSLLITLINKLMDTAIKLVTPKNETILRLTKSFIQYVGAIAVVYYCLSLFGFDSQSLLASAGLLTLVIGLGARDLITDILAGLFIIFENEFQVGDIIEVNNFKGRVIEIGIRTTRIINVKQDVRSINNRNLTNITNKTRRNSFCDIIITVGFDQDINAIEEMLDRELPKIKDKSPYIISGPTYGGIDEMSGRDMKLSIRTECLESRKFEVRTIVHKEIKRLFDENGFKLG